MSPRFERRPGGSSRTGRPGHSDRRRPGPGGSAPGDPGPRAGADGGRREWSRDGDSRRDGNSRRDWAGRPDRGGDRRRGRSDDEQRLRSDRDRSGRGRFKSDRFKSDRFGAERFLRDRNSRDRFGSGRFNAEGQAVERQGVERQGAERPGSDRPGSQRPDRGRMGGARYTDRRMGSGDDRRGGHRDDRSGDRRFARRDDRRDERRPSLRSPEPEAAAATPPADDLVWGRHASLAALEAGRPIHRIWCTPEMRSAAKFLQLLRDAKASGVLVEEVTWARLGQITGGSVHQGIALQTAAAETLDLDALISGCADLGEPPLLVALDGVTDPHNLGAVVRSAEAMGAHGVVLPQRRSAGLTGSAAKVAAGALEHLPVARVVNLNRSLEKLKDCGYRVIGLASEGDVTLTDVDLSGPLVLVTGSEDQGLSLLTRRHCDQLVRIPLRGVTPSLNASVATALCVYEVARRNWMKDIHGQAPSPPIQRARMAGQPGVQEPVIEQPAAEQRVTEQPLEAETDASATNSPTANSPTADSPTAPSPEQRIEIQLDASEPDPVIAFDQSIQLSP